MERAELIITALQQRIGEIVSNYETQIAMLRAELTELMNKEESKKEYSEYIENKVEEN